MSRSVSLASIIWISHTLPFLPSVALWGPMGVGKSTAVKTIAENLSKEFQQHVGVTDIRLLNFSPIDLRGIPSADINKEFTVWLKPKIFDLPKDIPLNLLDEFEDNYIDGLLLP